MTAKKGKEMKIICLDIGIQPMSPLHITVESVFYHVHVVITICCRLHCAFSLIY